MEPPASSPLWDKEMQLSTSAQTTAVPVICSPAIHVFEVNTVIQAVLTEEQASCVTEHG